MAHGTDSRRSLGIRSSFARLCLQTRLDLDIPQADLARRVGISRSYLGRIERGRANPSLALIDAITNALGLEIEILAKAPILLGKRGPRDSVHARCSAYVDRRLASLGLISAREVEVADGRIRGWIDLLAFDPRSHTLYIIEIKTRLDDLGGLERQLGVYERMAPSVARSIGWTPHRVSTWLLVLATDEVERVLRDSRPYCARVFTRRAPAMLDELRDGRSMSMEGRARGMALIDPRSRGRVWLIRSRVDGRRSAAPYRDYSDAARGHA